MKKKILFGVIALVTIVAFTGCDKILEFMFPDETGQGGGTNFVKLEVLIDPSIPNWWMYQVVGEIQNASGEPVKNNVRSGWAIDYGDRIAIVFSFDFLPAAEYRLNAWLDVNPQAGPQAEDPFVSLLTPGGQSSFEMPYDDPLTGEVEAMNEVWFTVNLFGAAGNVYFVGPAVWDYNSSYPTLYIAALGQPEDYFVSFDWSIEDPYGYVYESGSQSYANWFQPEMFSYTADWTAYYAVVRNVVAYVGGVETNLGTARGKITVINDDNGGGTILNYYPEIDSYGFESPPHNLGYGTYNVYIEIVPWNRAGTYSSFVGTLQNGSFYLAGPDLVGYNGYGGPGLDRALVYIDVDGDYYFYGENDIAANVDLAVPYWWGSGYNAWFDVPADRYIKYPDFARIYLGGIYP